MQRLKMRKNVFSIFNKDSHLPCQNALLTLQNEQDEHSEWIPYISE